MTFSARIVFLIVHATVHFFVVMLPASFGKVRAVLPRAAGTNRRHRVAIACANCEASHRHTSSTARAAAGSHEGSSASVTASVPFWADAAAAVAAGTRSTVPLTVPADKRFCAPYLADDDLSRPTLDSARLIFNGGGGADSMFGLTRERPGYLADAATAPLYGGHVSTIVPAVFRSTEPVVLHREVVRSYDGVQVAMDWGRSSWYFDAAVPDMVSSPAESKVGGGVPMPPSGWYDSVYPIDASCDAKGATAGLALRHGRGAKFYGTFQRCAAAPSQMPRAVVAICPGLTSTCDSFYIRSLMRHLLQQGYDPVLINTRGLGVAINRRAKFMCAAITDDLRHVVRSYLSPDALRRRYYGAGNGDALAVPPLLMVGFSMGANVMSKTLAEDGATMLTAEAAGDASTALATTCHQYVKAAIAVSAPWDFFGASFHLVRGINYFLYDRSLASGVTGYWGRNCESYQLEDHDDDARDNAALPPRPAPCLACVDHPTTGVSAVSLREFDEAVVAPFYGYADAETYYRDAEAFRRLHTLRTPLLALSATEDPIVGPARPDAHWERTVNGIKWPFGTAPAEEPRPTTWAEHDTLLKKRAAAMQPAPMEQRPPIAYMRVPTGGHLGFLGTPLQEWRGEPNMSERIILRALANATEA